ncbi:MAG: 3-dehydroquinate synthase [Candidatus Eisenbacteria bacterium]|nr:3-dehydroquinate synthase [Candidatus Latescibacterota bacterium]MBD3302372.1 3-dehydroquinate synthase [Candidatus Eisenbacteria bacterium]
MSREIAVDLGERSYRVLLSPLREWNGIELPEIGSEGQGLLVSDDRVGPLWADRVGEGFRRRGLATRTSLFPAGEKSKRWETLLGLYDACLEVEIRRDGWILALGGGVAGDLAGFAAATYLRGVAFIQIPTSLLAMVDSSVGGKVGIDYAGAKNLVGAFHQPRLVLAAPEFLSTLPDEELANGLAEVVKAGLIGDPALFALLEERVEPIWRREEPVLEEMIARAIAVKARIVEEDEREAGLRQVLNLGHTLGHALEASRGFGEIRHGEAVAVGLVAACQLSHQMGLAPEGLRDRVERLLERHRLPTRARGCTWEEVEPWIRFDKKTRADGIRFVLTGNIGDVSVHRRVPMASIREAASYVLA